MCVAVFSPKGVNAPTEEQIRKMFNANPDGAGIAYNGRGGKVVYEKGFMDVESLLERLRPLEQWKNKNLGLHFRIGTSGKNDPATCHPMPITTSISKMREIKGEGPVLFHNGVLGTGGIVDDNSSDTQDFVVAFEPMLKKPVKSVARTIAIESFIGDSKLLVMYDHNKYKMYGDWKKDGDLFVSNLYYTYYSSSRYYSTSSYQSKAYEDDYDYDTYHRKAIPETATTGVSESEQIALPLDDDMDVDLEDENDYEGAFDKWMKEKDEQQIKEWWDLLHTEGSMWFLSRAQMEMFLDSADEIAEAHLMKDGEKYCYDLVDLFVWADTDGRW